MTVVRNLPEQLILAHAPWLLGGSMIVCIVGCAAAGLALLAAGEVSGLMTLVLGTCVPLGIFALTVKRDQVVFDAVSGTVTLQRRTLLSYASAVYPLHTIDRAEVQELADTARPLLLFRTERPAYPMVEAFADAARAQRTQQVINTWLHTQAQRGHA